MNVSSMMSEERLLHSLGPVVLLCGT